MSFSTRLSSSVMQSSLAIGLISLATACSSPFGPEDLVGTWRLQRLNDADPGDLVVTLRMDPVDVVIGQCQWHLEEGDNVVDLACTYLFGEVQSTLNLTVGEGTEREYLAGGVRQGEVFFISASIPGAPEYGNDNTLVFNK